MSHVTETKTSNHKHKRAHNPSAASFSASPSGWARALLQAMGLPVTAGNVTVIEEWEAREGGNWLNTARYNPLNTTQQEAGATSINSVGVKAYTSWQEGLQATVTTLRNGYYDHILAALKRNDQAGAIAAIRSSPWAGSGGYHTWVDPASAAAYDKAHHGAGKISAGNAPRQPLDLTGDLSLSSLDTSLGGGMSVGGISVTLILVLVAVVLIFKK